MAGNPSSLPERQTAVLMSIGVESEVLALFENGFHDANIDVRVVRMRTEEDLNNTRFDGCIIRLDEWAPELLAHVRRSTLNARALVYGVGPASCLSSVAQFGINALVENGKAAEVNEAVWTSYLLLLGKMRRFLRLPLVVPVQIEGSDQPRAGFTTDISGGGMTIDSDSPLPRSVRLHLALPGAGSVVLPAVVCWRSTRKSGVQFLESADVDQVKQWINDYLGIVPEPAPQRASAASPGIGLRRA